VNEINGTIHMLEIRVFTDMVVRSFGQYLL